MLVGKLGITSLALFGPEGPLAEGGRGSEDERSSVPKVRLLPGRIGPRHSGVAPPGWHLRGSLQRKGGHEGGHRGGRQRGLQGAARGERRVLGAARRRR